MLAVQVFFFRRVLAPRLLPLIDHCEAVFLVPLLAAWGRGEMKLIFQVSPDKSVQWVEV